MDLEKEQLADLGWARDVLEGMGDSDDNRQHALWLARKIASNSATAKVHTDASTLVHRVESRCYLNPNTFCFLRAQQEAR